MFRHKALFIALIAMIALVLTMSGCTTIFPTGPASTAGAPTAMGPTTSPSGPTVAPGTFKVTTEGKNVKITGNGVVKTDTFKLPENWYTKKVTYDGSKQAGRMDYLDLQLMDEADTTASGIMVEKAGTYVYYEGVHYPMTSSSTTTDTFYIETREPTVGSWVVEFTAPPAESSVATAPKTFTGTGSALVGPVKLPTQKGKAEISYDGQGSFGITFFQQDINYDQYPSYFMTLPDSYAYGQGPSYTKTVDIDNYDPNLLLLLELNAPSGGSWTIKISPA